MVKSAYYADNTALDSMLDELVSVMCSAHLGALHGRSACALEVDVIRRHVNKSKNHLECRGFATVKHYDQLVS